MQQNAQPGQAAPAESFPTDPSGLPEATRPELLELADGDAFDLRIGPVAKRLEDTTVRMLGYNGSIPGPTLKVQQGSEVIVHVTNDGDLDTTVHWHGLRLENKYDGVPHETQTPIPVGGEFTYRIRFPDPGLYWYHPHIREDYTQEMGLYGNILVVPAEQDYWPPARRDVLLTLDDLLIEDGKIAPFSPVETTYTAMGRFGNVLLIGGEQDCSLSARAGEVVRLWLTNTANTRVFNVTLPGARMKLVGGDSGRVEQEEFVSSVILAPSERAVVDVLFDQPGQLELQHRTPERTYRLAEIAVTGEPPVPSLAGQFAVLRNAPELAQWLRQVHPTTTWTTSVCTGAIYLAAAGILDGQEATTHWAWAEQLERYGARYTEQRVVEHGKVITAAGVSAGIDMGLTLLARMYGAQLAEGVQLAIEYDPQPPFDTGSPSKAPAEIVEFVRSQLNTLAAAQPASTG